MKVNNFELHDINETIFNSYNREFLQGLIDLSKKMDFPFIAFDKPNNSYQLPTEGVIWCNNLFEAMDFERHIYTDIPYIDAIEQNDEWDGCQLFPVSIGWRLLHKNSIYLVYYNKMLYKGVYNG